MLNPSNALAHRTGLELATSDHASPTQDLNGLRAKINYEIGEAEKGLDYFFLHAIEAGRYLCRAKASVVHGTWLTWFKASEFTFSDRTAQRYMKAFTERSELSPHFSHGCSAFVRRGIWWRGQSTWLLGET